MAQCAVHVPSGLGVLQRSPIEEGAPTMFALGQDKHGSILCCLFEACLYSQVLGHNAVDGSKNDV